MTASGVDRDATSWVVAVVLVEWWVGRNALAVDDGRSGRRASRVAVSDDVPAQSSMGRLAIA